MWTLNRPPGGAEVVWGIASVSPNYAPVFLGAISKSFVSSHEFLYAHVDTASTPAEPTGAVSTLLAGLTVPVRQRIHVRCRTRLGMYAFGSPAEQDILLVSTILFVITLTRNIVAAPAISPVPERVRRRWHLPRRCQGTRRVADRAGVGRRTAQVVQHKQTGGRFRVAQLARLRRLQGQAVGQARTPPRSPTQPRTRKQWEGKSAQAESTDDSNNNVYVTI